MEQFAKYNIGKKPEESNNASPHRLKLPKEIKAIKSFCVCSLLQMVDNAKEFHTADRLQEECNN